MRIEIYKAADGWRWRLKARNGRIVADSGEAYTRERDAKRAADRMLLGAMRLWWSIKVPPTPYTPPNQVRGVTYDVHHGTDSREVTR